MDEAQALRIWLLKAFGLGFKVAQLEEGMRRGLPLEQAQGELEAIFVSDSLGFDGFGVPATPRSVTRCYRSQE